MIKLNLVLDIFSLTQHWEGDPDAINSVRRDQKPLSLQQEQLLFSRGRRFDQKNAPTTSSNPYGAQPITECRSPLVKRVMGERKQEKATLVAVKGAGVLKDSSKKKSGGRKLSIGSKNKIQPS